MLRPTHKKDLADPCPQDPAIFQEVPRVLPFQNNNHPPEQNLIDPLDQYSSQPSMIRPKFLKLSGSKILTQKGSGDSEIRSKSIEDSEDSATSSQISKISRNESMFSKIPERAYGSNINVSVSQRLQQKADRISKGTYRGPKPVTASSLQEKADRIRLENIREYETASQHTLSNASYFKTYGELAHSQSIDKLLVQTDGSRSRSYPDQVRSEISKSKYQSTGLSSRISMDQLVKYTATQIYHYYIKKVDVKPHMQTVKAEIQRKLEQEKITCWGFLTKYICPPVQNQHLRLRLLCLSKVQFSSTQDQFVLLVFWKVLTGKKYTKYGPHWEEIGFRSRDPSIDFRHSGVLALFQIYYLLNKHKEYCKQMFKMATASNMAQSFATTLIRVTEEYVRLLLVGKVEGSTLKEYTDVYCALVYHVLEKLKAERFKVQDANKMVEQEICKMGKKVVDIVRRYNKAISV